MKSNKTSKRHIEHVTCIKNTSGAGTAYISRIPEFENKRTNNDLQSNPQNIELHAPHKIPGVNSGGNVRSSWRELRYSGNVSSS
jgi:hypothetical protein